MQEEQQSNPNNSGPADEHHRHHGYEEGYQDGFEGDGMAHGAPEQDPQPTSRTPLEQAAGAARDQATQAADAFRRGEFIHEAANDPGASADDRLIAFLVYIIPVFMPVLVLLSETSQERPFQRFHAKQSLALTGIFAAIGVAASIATAILQIIPPIGMLVAILLACLSPIAVLMYVVAVCYYGYQAYQGKRFAIPGLTNFLREQGWL